MRRDSPSVVDPNVVIRLPGDSFAGWRVRGIPKPDERRLRRLREERRGPTVVTARRAAPRSRISLRRKQRMKIPRGPGYGASAQTISGESQAGGRYAFASESG